MLARIVLQLKNTTEKIITTNMSSAFQGILMELLEEDFARQLHSQQRHPYSQYIKCEGGLVYWTVSAITKEAYEKIIIPLADPNLTELYCRYHEILFEVQDRHMECIKESEFLQNQYFKDFSKSFELTFLTPTSFKSEGKYINYPTVRWVFQSLMNKHDDREGSNRIFDEDTLQMIAEQTVISQYRLKSTLFHLEGMKIPSFVGDLKIYAKCNQSIVNLMNYLLKFGEYSGVGIKSAIGMGAFRVTGRERK